MQRPNILVIAGHDPSGGAGIHADIEAIHACGGHACSIITGLTIQDSQTVEDFQLVDIAFLKRQADKLLADMEFSAIKVGMTGSAAIVRWISDLKRQLPSTPLIVDPVLAAETGGALIESSHESVPDSLCAHLLPQAALCTPNLEEALILSKAKTIEEAGQKLLDTGCDHALITGTHDQTEQVENHLFYGQQQITHGWPRLPGSFHGSGCTLASACSALIARGLPIDQAVGEAQQKVFDWLQHGWTPGRGQKVPDRTS